MVSLRMNVPLSAGPPVTIPFGVWCRLCSDIMTGPLLLGESTCSKMHPTGRRPFRAAGPPALALLHMSACLT